MRYRLLCWKDLDYGVECRQLVIDLMAPLRWSRNGRGFYLNNSKKVADFTGAQETNTLEKTRRLHDVAPMVRPLRLSLGFPVLKFSQHQNLLSGLFFLEGKKERLIHLFNQQLGQFWLDKAGIRPKIKWKQLVLRLISEYLRQCKLLSREKKKHRDYIFRLFGRKSFAAVVWARHATLPTMNVVLLLDQRNIQHFVASSSSAET